jgi:hypothetical protein
MNAKDRAFYVQQLASDECLCGRPKKRGYAFCYKCYRALPDEMRKALWKRLRAGFEDAYEEAVTWLQMYQW